MGQWRRQGDIRIIAVRTGPPLIRDPHLYVRYEARVAAIVVIIPHQRCAGAQRLYNEDRTLFSDDTPPPYLSNNKWARQYCIVSTTTYVATAPASRVVE